MVAKCRTLPFRLVWWGSQSQMYLLYCAGMSDLSTCQTISPISVKR